MKTLTKILFLSLTIGLASCSDDGDDNQNNNNNTKANLSNIIEGDWKLTSLEQKNGETKTNGTVITTFSGSGSDFQGVITFNTDGTVRSEIAYKMTQVLTVSGTTQTVTTDIPGTVTKGNYEILSNTEIKTSVTAAGNNTPTTFEVSGLSPTTMTWESKIEQTTTQGGATATTTFDLTYALEKVN